MTGMLARTARIPRMAEALVSNRVQSRARTGCRAGLILSMFGRHGSDTEALLGQLRPYVVHRDALPAAMVEGAPEVLPDLVMAVLADLGDRAQLLSPTAMEAFGGADLLRRRAIENLVRLPRPTRTELWAEGLAGPPFIALDTADVSCTAWLADRAQLMTAAGAAWPTAHGFLVAAPHRGSVLLYVLADDSPPEALAPLIEAASSGYQQSTADGRVSPDVFLVEPDGRSRRVTAWP
jgi:hypothetical protein